MKGIDPEVATDKLNVLPNAKPVKQKQRQRHSGAEKDAIIEQEVQRLLKVGYIR